MLEVNFCSCEQLLVLEGKLVSVLQKKITGDRTVRGQCPKCEAYHEFYIVDGEIVAAYEIPVKKKVIKEE